jgi:glucosylceramidase
MKIRNLNFDKRWYGKVFAIVAIAFSFSASCSKNNGNGGTGTPPAVTGTVEQWFTNTTRTQLLQKQTALLAFKTEAPTGVVVELDDATTYQTMDGFGYTLTGGSAKLIHGMSASARTNLLNEVFGKGANSIGVSYLRVSIGASDLSPSAFTYNDLPAGQTDLTLSKFSLALDTVDMVPVLKEILAIRPDIKLMGSPWSAPAWMKDNGSLVGGSLMPAYYSVYAQYFVKYVQAMKTRGINIDAITVQNEPQHGGNNPSMIMSAAQQTDFIKSHLGPAFRDAGISTKIIIWDHNCDNPNFPITVLNDAAAKPFINGSAFHLYAGSITALSQVKDAHPDKDIYFTEQWTSSGGNFGGDLMWHMQNVMIGSTRNWAKVALQWNLANDPFMGPHTPGGCTQCLGALTINGDTWTKNVSYYNVAQFSKFIPPASKRIKTTAPGNVTQVAFVTPDNKRVLVVLNEGTGTFNFNIKWKNTYASASLPGGTVATYVW